MSKTIIDQAWNSYTQTVQGYAARIFETKVLPHLKKHQLGFGAGNGQWWLTDAAGNVLKDEQGWVINYACDLLPQWIVDILHRQVPGHPQHDLGSLMPNYSPLKEQNHAKTHSRSDRHQ